MIQKSTIAMMLLLGVALMFSTGCAKKITRTGFLDSYAGIEKDPEGFAMWVYLDEDTDWSSYNKIMLDEVEFFFSEKADYKGI